MLDNNAIGEQVVLLDARFSFSMVSRFLQHAQEHAWATEAASASMHVLSGLLQVG